LDPAFDITPARYITGIINEEGLLDPKDIKKYKMIKFEELNWKELDALDREKTIFFLPISPMEEHGPHLSLGTDLFSARDAAAEA
jgi:hypothetical protein